MPPIIAFIGWHNSGKTTLAAKVLAILRQRGLRVAAIKSSHKTGIVFDQATTDTGVYKAAGAAGVLLVAPDQIVLQTQNDGAALTALAERFFPDHDLVISEGFKRAEGVAKIEVRRGGQPHGDEPLTTLVDGIVALVSDEADAFHEHLFRSGQTQELADFIQTNYLAKTKGRRLAQTPRVSLTIDGQVLPLKDWVQEALAGTVLGFVSALKKTEGMDEGEVVLRIWRGAPEP